MKQAEGILFIISAACYLAALASLFTKHKKIAEIISITAFAFHSAMLILRTLASGRLPFAGLYESLIIFSWGVMACAVIFSRKFQNSKIYGPAIPTVIAAFVFALTTDSTIKPLMPVLRSPWLAIHVALAIAAYGGFAFAGGLGIMYVLKENFPKLSLPEKESLDSMCASIITMAFPLMLGVIITGSIWGKYAWGSYWQWDPKETWALITALVYGAFIYTRFELGWQGSKSAKFAIIGFAVVIFCYLGVNLLMPGVHSYGAK